jgi:hypothetical protein
MQRPPRYDDTPACTVSGDAKIPGFLRLNPLQRDGVETTPAKGDAEAGGLTEFFRRQVDKIYNIRRPAQIHMPKAANLPAPKQMEIHMAMKRVIVESPYAGDVQANEEYLKQCLYDCVRRGECPFASHAFFPFFLHEQDPKERQMGIELGYVFWDQAHAVVFYIDRGISPGMEKALSKALELGIPIERRRLNGSTKRLTAEVVTPGTEWATEKLEEELKKMHPAKTHDEKQILSPHREIIKAD